MKSNPPCILCNIIAAMIALGIFAPVAWWAFDRQPVYRMEAGEAHLAPGDRKRPDIMALDIVWNRLLVFRAGCSGTYQREVIDSIGHVFTFTETKATFASLPVGIHRNVHSAVPWSMPEGAEDGVLTMRSRIKMVCNPVHEYWPITYVSPDVTFDLQRPRINRGPQSSNVR